MVRSVEADSPYQRRLVQFLRRSERMEFKWSAILVRTTTMLHQRFRMMEQGESKAEGESLSSLLVFGQDSSSNVAYAAMVISTDFGRNFQRPLLCVDESSVCCMPHDILEATTADFLSTFTLLDPLELRDVRPLSSPQSFLSHLLDFAAVLGPRLSSPYWSPLQWFCSQWSVQRRG